MELPKDSCPSDTSLSESGSSGTGLPRRWGERKKRKKEKGIIFFCLFIYIFFCSSGPPSDLDLLPANVDAGLTIRGECKVIIGIILFCFIFFANLKTQINTNRSVGLKNVVDMYAQVQELLVKFASVNPPNILILGGIVIKEGGGEERKKIKKPFFNFFFFAFDDWPL